MLKTSARTTFVIAGLTVLLPFLLRAQSPAATCAGMKDGVFHQYSSRLGQHIIIQREGDMQKETMADGKDSMLWKVEWKDDCDYTLKLISTTLTLDDQMSSFFKKHKMAIHITQATADYYTFSQYIDKPSGTLLESDTVWTKERAYTSAAVPLLVVPVQDNNAIRKAHFSDTSHYAIIYIYRPGKTLLSLSSYMVYLDDGLIAVLKNKSGYIFAVQKQGKIIIKSKLAKDEAVLPMEIKSGKKYYIRSTINWGFYHGRNSKLELELVPESEGRGEFDAVQ